MYLLLFLSEHIINIHFWKSCCEHLNFIQMVGNWASTFSFFPALFYCVYPFGVDQWWLFTTNSIRSGSLSLLFTLPWPHSLLECLQNLATIWLGNFGKSASLPCKCIRTLQFGCPFLSWAFKFGFKFLSSVSILTTINLPSDSLQ